MKNMCCYLNRKMYMYIHSNYKSIVKRKFSFWWLQHSSFAPSLDHLVYSMCTLPFTMCNIFTLAREYASLLTFFFQSLYNKWPTKKIFLYDRRERGIVQYWITCPLANNTLHVPHFAKRWRFYVDHLVIC